MRLNSFFSCALIPLDLAGEFFIINYGKKLIFNIHVTTLKIFHFVIMKKE